VHETDRLALLHQKLVPLRTALIEHPVYKELNRIDELRIFMEHHVIAVWDFMSLAHAVRSELGGNILPWRPSPHTTGLRLIGEILLGEESDDDGRGGYISHYEMYLEAMSSAGANMDGIHSLIEHLSADRTTAEYLSESNVPRAAQDFVLETFKVIETKDVTRITSYFVFGRESLLPDIFVPIVEAIDRRDVSDLSRMTYYLSRHIDLDGDSHGPLGERLICDLCGTDESRWQVAEEAALHALEVRKNLWDAIQLEISCSVSKVLPPKHQRLLRQDSL